MKTKNLAILAFIVTFIILLVFYSIPRNNNKVSHPKKNETFELAVFEANNLKNLDKEFKTDSKTVKVPVDKNSSETYYYDFPGSTNRFPLKEKKWKQVDEKLLRQEKANGGHGEGKVVAQKFIDQNSGIIKVTTKVGDFSFRLRPDAAPETARLIKRLVIEKFYDRGATCYRAHPDFLLQCGPVFVNGTNYHNKYNNLPLEFYKHVKLPHYRGAVGIARGGSPKVGKDTFYISVTPSSSLGGTVFAEMRTGMDVIDKIMKLPVNPRKDTYYLQEFIPLKMKLVADPNPPREWKNQSQFQ